MTKTIAKNTVTKTIAKNTVATWYSSNKLSLSSWLAIFAKPLV